MSMSKSDETAWAKEMIADAVLETVWESFRITEDHDERTSVLNQANRVRKFLGFDTKTMKYIHEFYGSN